MVRDNPFIKLCLKFKLKSNYNFSLTFSDLWSLVGKYLFIMIFVV